MNKKFRNRLQFIEITTTILLVLLWSLSSGGKLTDLNTFKRELSAQVFSIEFVQILFYSIPSVEIFTALLLVHPKTRLAGLSLSLVLMTLFTGYIGLVLLGYYHRVPCACISLIPGMSFNAHLFFNLIFMAVAMTGFIFTLKERRLSGMGKIVSHAPLTGRT